MYQDCVNSAQSYFSQHRRGKETGDIKNIEPLKQRRTS